MSTKLDDQLYEIKQAIQALQNDVILLNLRYDSLVDAINRTNKRRGR